MIVHQDRQSQGFKLLYLLPFPPRLDATHGGGRVAGQFLYELALRHRIALLYFRSPFEPPIDPVIRERLAIVEEVIRPWTGNSISQFGFRNARLMVSLLRFKPMWATDWASKAFRQKVRWLSETWQPDIIQLEHHIMGQYLDELNGCRAPRVMTEHEPGIQAAPYLKQTIPIISPLLHRLDQLAWRRFEPAVIRRVQMIIVFTNRDRLALEDLGLPTPIQKIPFGTVIPDRPLNSLGYRPYSLLFVGSFFHSPNIEAAMRLAQTIFPAVQKHFPELELYLIGDQPPAGLKRLADERIHVTGKVPDLTPYLDRAAVVIAPLFSGGGMRVKVLEALSAGKAVVATPLAAEGLDVEDGNQIQIGESDQELAVKIVQLLKDPDQRASLASRARAWACANLEWDKAIQAYEQVYQNLTIESAMNS